MVAGAKHNKIKIFFTLIFTLCISCTYNRPSIMKYDIEDGLPENANKIDFFDLTKNDDYGISYIETFLIDINNDKKQDIIKRGRFITGNAHGYSIYNIYLDNNKHIAHFRTNESADCFLTVYKFQFNPFSLIKVSRDKGKDNWEQPTNTKIETFKIINNTLVKVSEEDVGKICDVRELLK